MSPSTLTWYVVCFCPQKIAILKHFVDWNISDDKIRLHAINFWQSSPSSTGNTIDPQRSSTRPRDTTDAAASLAVCARMHELQTLHPGPVYFSEDFRLVPRSILAGHCVRPPVPTSWFLPNAGPRLATAHLPPQKHWHRTHFRPVYLRAVSRFIPATSENFSVPATTASVTLITVSWS